MNTTPFVFEPLFIKDSSEIIGGKRVGTFDILNRKEHESGYKWIGDVKPYGGTFPDYEEAKAYAKLFAASPDMLNALIEIKKHLLSKGYSALDPAYACLINAIDRATA